MLCDSLYMLCQTIKKGVATIQEMTFLEGLHGSMW